ncbi:hypothetical protein SAMN05421780_101541 [Flexibacter flexilis DSM 6793]|uniref:Uncharacterized protein n=1 Tax=Flexibacter flexilis DSM 6793 TaxID=927664 RepID=A0A1I1E4I8_9BACT|nr:hypothetical protein [Flexibacter flexilis]SFB80128.1 hypothetical protein SAMN05421780_101541 [Flexibacter flexilis DSM 6793]
MTANARQLTEDIWGYGKSLIVVLMAVANFFLVRTLNEITANLESLNQRTNTLLQNDAVREQVILNYSEKLNNVILKQDALSTRVYEIEKQIIINNK